MRGATNTAIDPTTGDDFVVPDGETWTIKELFIQKLITDGVIAISAEHNTVKLAKKLESFLTPAARPANAKSLQEIRSRYRELRSGQAPVTGARPA